MYFLNESIAISDSTKSITTAAKAYKLRSLAHKNLGNFQLSLNDFEQYTILKDSIFSTSKTQQIEELRTIFEMEQKEQQIKNQKNEIELLKINNQLSNTQLLLLILALMIAILSIYALRQKMKRNKVERKKIQSELEFKTKELTTHALHLAKKNEVLNDLKQKAKVFKADTDADPGYQMLIQTINFDLQDDNNWENFSRYFEEVHKDFNANAQKKYPKITSNDLRLMALIKMNLSSKEIANILNISNDGIKKARQRLRKKMGIASDESLENIVISI